MPASCNQRFAPPWRVIHERCWHGMGRRHPSGGQLQIWISTPQTAAADGHHFARADPASLGDLIAMAGPSARLAACGPQITFLPDAAGRVVALGVDRFKDPSCVCCHQCKRLHVSAKCNVHQCPAGEARFTPSPAHAAPAICADVTPCSVGGRLCSTLSVFTCNLPGHEYSSGSPRVMLAHQEAGDRGSPREGVERRKW